MIDSRINTNRSWLANRLRHYPLTVCCLLLFAAPAIAQDQSLAPAGFTAEQAAQGEREYNEQCAICHGYSLEGFELAPSLSGNFFSRRWGDKPIEALAANLQRMPPTVAGGLGARVYSQILAYMLQQNGVTAGATALPEALADLGDLMVPAQALVDQPFTPRIPGYASNGPLFPTSRLDELSPVSNAMLMNPPADDWLVWRRTHENLGHSPLDQIDTSNVDELRVAWTWSLPPGANMMTPLVHDGVLFAYSFGDVVQAIDAASGDLLWGYQRELISDASPNSKKGVAIYEDKIIVATSDVHLLALDSKTGKLIWDHEIDTGNETDHTIKAAPMVVNGKAIIGLTGQRAVAGGNFIVAVDLETGTEAWRFYTIARPDAAGGNSWNGLPLEERTGGSVWTPGSYDAELNLLYFGPAPTYDTDSLRVLANAPNISTDALYTNSTIALNADNGELVWHYQHMRNDQLDHDWAFERQIINLPVNGEMRKTIVTGGKEAIFEALDAATGDYLFSIDLDMQNVITEIDSRTGAKTLNPAAIPEPGQVLAGLSMNGICPDALGARNMQSTSYNPNSGILYIPMQDTCVNNLTGKRWQKYPNPEENGLWGMVKAVDRSRHPPAAISLPMVACCSPAPSIGGLRQSISVAVKSSGNRGWIIPPAPTRLPTGWTASSLSLLPRTQAVSTPTAWNAPPASPIHRLALHCGCSPCRIRTRGRVLHIAKTKADAEFASCKT